MALPGQSGYAALAMACVRDETAACHQARLEADLPAQDGPDESECRSTCTNLAYTDRSIAEQRLRLKRWDTTAAYRLTPRPLRDRAAALAADSHAIIDAHEHTPVTNDQTREH